jgi:hypothetical protein
MGAGFKKTDKYIRTFSEYVYMSRPKPKVLLEITNKKSYKTDQVLESDAIWAVFYQDKPINIKKWSNTHHSVNSFEELKKEINYFDHNKKYLTKKN